jgi:hypothetical protein
MPRRQLYQARVNLQLAKSDATIAYYNIEINRKDPPKTNFLKTAFKLAF